MNIKLENTDNTHDITVFLSIELPYWISIESGKYLLNSKRELNLRNNLFLVSIGNIIDGPISSIRRTDIPTAPERILQYSYSMA